MFEYTTLCCMSLGIEMPVYSSFCITMKQHNTFLHHPVYCDHELEISLV